MTNINGFKETIAWYENNAENYAKKIESSPETTLLDRFTCRLKKDAIILDAGCAGGRDSRIFKDKNFKPIGLDISKSLIKLAKKINPDIEFMQGNFLNLPFPTDTFDGIWAHASLIHFEKITEVDKSLKEFHRVLKPEGVIHIFVKQQLGNEKTKNISHDYSVEFKRFFRFFTKQEIETLLKKTGFKIINIQDNYVSPDGRKNIKWIAVLAQKD